MLFSNGTINDIKSQSLAKIATDKERYFAVVDDNGLLVTKYPLHATEAIMCLKNVECKEFPSAFETKKFAFTTYFKKYFVKYRRVPKNLKDFPPEYLWLNDPKTLKISSHWTTDYTLKDWAYSTVI